MFCDRCGTEVREGQNFCPSCGRSFGSAQAPAATQHTRVASHLKTLGILWIAYSILLLIPMVAILIFGSAGPPWWRHEAHVPPFVGPMIAALGGLGAVLAFLGILSGWGLLERRSWARSIAIVLGCLVLLSIPFGTALGIYTLWVLIPAASKQEYRGMAALGLSGG